MAINRVEPKVDPYTTSPRARYGRLTRRSRYASAAAALAVLLGTGVGTTAVAQAATTSSTHGSKPNGHRGAWAPPAAAGAVESVGTGTFTLQEHNGTTVTVDVGPTTAYKVRGVTSPTFANITKGEKVTVEGTTSSGIVSASSVFVGSGATGRIQGPGRGPGHGTPPAAAGTVESVGTGTFTLQVRNGTTDTVNVGLSTSYKDRSVKSPTFANITKGEMVLVEGTTSGSVVTASSVFIGAGVNRNHGWST